MTHPLHVRLAAHVCACGDHENEHDLNSKEQRTRCSRITPAGKCPCTGYSHAQDRYQVSTYLDVPAGAPTPQVALQQLGLG